MAKKQLKQPSLPAGQRTSFFLYLQELVLRAGDLPVAELGSKVGYSHQTIYKALTGPKMPSSRVVVALAQVLGDEDTVMDVCRRWENAVSEQRSAQLGVSEIPAISSRISPESSENLSPTAHDELCLRLKQAVDDSPLKLEAHAEHTGVMSRSTAYNIISGRVLPRWVSIEWLARELRLSTDELYPLYLEAVRERELRRRSARRQAAKA
jgi:predicted DNA-binding transcriptional regulator AlpA/DNA-binding XRE family transcriptional regulator